MMKWSYPVDENNPLKASKEVIKTRLLELLEITIATLNSQPMKPQQRAMIQGSSMMITLGLKKVESTKLDKWLKCLSEIGQAVRDLDCSPDEYEMKMESLVNELVEMLKE